MYNDYSSLLLNGLMLALALPLHVLFIKFLWDTRPQPGGLLLALAAAAAASLLLTPLEATRYLAGSGAVMAALQYFSSAHVRRVGMKVV